MTTELPNLQKLLPFVDISIVKKGIYECWLEPLVANSLMTHCANMIKSTPEEEKIIEKEKAILKDSYNIISTSHFNEWCELRGLTEERMNSVLMRSRRWDQWINDNLQKELQAYASINRLLYESVSFEMIKSKSKQIIMEIYFRMEEKSTSMSEQVTIYACKVAYSGHIGPVAISQIEKRIGGILLKNKNKSSLIEPFFNEGNWCLLKIINWQSMASDKINEQCIKDFKSHWLNTNVKCIIADYLRRK